MLTTCPECRATFRVGQVQLDAKRGMVRCGRCSAVFNAYDTLLPELESPPAWGESGTQGRKATVFQEPGVGRGRHAPDALSAAYGAASGSPEGHPPEPVAEPELPEPQVSVPGPEEPEGALEEGAIAPEPVQEPVISAAMAMRREPDPESTDAILFAELPRRPVRAQGSGWGLVGWGVAVTGLALLLCLQLAYFLRAELVQWLPSTRPLVIAGCRMLGCDLPLPRDLDAIHIEMSALEADPEDASRTTLRLSLGNHGDRTVAWPHLVLVLTDTRDVPIAQRPFAPAEYLPKGVDPALGLGPGQEQEIRLGLKLIDLSAYGYRVEKRYP